MYYYFSKIKNHLLNWFNYIVEHLIRVLTIGIFLFLICYLFINFSSKINIVEQDSIAVQHILFFGITLENWSTFLVIVGTISAAIWALYEFDKMVSRNQQEKSSEIAQSFADNLVERFSIISYVLMQNQEMKQLLAKVGNSNLKSFTTFELKEITGDPQCFNKCYKIINSKKTQKRYLDKLKKIYNEDEQKKFDSYFPLMVENTLNRLEAICINISSQAAGSEYIYNSLHQSFLQFVEILAIKISTNNTNNVDKFYTNIIQVYNMWNKQKNKDIQKLKMTEKKISKLNSKVDNEIRKLLEKKNKTV